MGDHTKEPWRVVTLDDDCIIIDANETLVETFYGQSGCGYARRIVACVNALAHISTEQLESGEMLNLGLIVKDQRKAISDLESALAKSASREAALVEKLMVAEGALVGLRRVVPYFWNDDNAHISELDEACEKADAALAKIKEASNGTV